MNVFPHHPLYGKREHMDYVLIFCVMAFVGILGSLEITGIVASLKHNQPVFGFAIASLLFSGMLSMMAVMVTLWRNITKLFDNHPTGYALAFLNTLRQRSITIIVCMSAIVSMTAGFNNLFLGYHTWISQGFLQQKLAVVGLVFILAGTVGLLEFLRYLKRIAWGEYQLSPDTKR